MDTLKTQFIVFFFIINIKYSYEPPLSCRWDFSKSSWCPSYSTEYTSQWQTQARCLKCSTGMTYHCARVLDNNEEETFFKEQCAVPRDCDIGTEPRIGLHDGKVTCENCHDPDTFNDYDNTLSSIFSECPLKKTICIKTYNRIECGRSPKFSSENRYCRCDARNNYVFSSGQPNEHGCSNSLSMKCSLVPACPEGKDRSVKGESRACLDNCTQGYYRPNDSDDCFKNPDLPDYETTVAITSSSISLVNTTILPPGTTSQPQGVSPPIQGSSNSLSSGEIVGIVIACLIILVLIGGMCLIGCGLKFCGYSWRKDSIESDNGRTNLIGRGLKCCGYTWHKDSIDYGSSYSLAPTENPDAIPKPIHVEVKKTSSTSVTLGWSYSQGVDSWQVINAENDSVLKTIQADHNKSESAVEAKIKGLEAGYKYKFIVKAKVQQELSEGVEVEATTSGICLIGCGLKCCGYTWHKDSVDYAPQPAPQVININHIGTQHITTIGAQHNTENIGRDKMTLKGKNPTLYSSNLDNEPETEGASSSTSSPSIQQQTNVPEVKKTNEHNSTPTNKEVSKTRDPVPKTGSDKKEPPSHCNVEDEGTDDKDHHVKNGDSVTNDGHHQESSMGDGQEHMITLSGKGDVYSQGISKVLDGSQIGCSGDHYKDGEDVKDSERNDPALNLPKATLHENNNLTDQQIKALKEDAIIVSPDNKVSENTAYVDKNNGNQNINLTLHIEITENGNKKEETYKKVKCETDCAESLKENKLEDDNKTGKSEQRDNNLTGVDGDCKESLVPPYEPKKEHESYSDDKRHPNLEQNDSESGLGSDENYKDANNDADSIEKQVCPQRLGRTAAQLNGVYQVILQKSKPYIIDHMAPISLCDKFTEIQLFEYTDIRDMEQMDNVSKRNREIWKFVYEGGSEKYVKFKKCLDDTKQYNIVDKLEKFEEGILNMPDKRNDTDEDKNDENDDNDDDSESNENGNTNASNIKNDHHQTTYEDSTQLPHSNDVGDGKEKPVQENHTDIVEEESPPESTDQNPNTNTQQLSIDEVKGNAEQQSRVDEISEQPAISDDTNNNDDEAMEKRAFNFLQLLHKIVTEKKEREFESTVDKIEHENVDLFNFPFQQVLAIGQPYSSLRNCPSDFQAFRSSGKDNSCLYQSISLLLSGTERYQHRLRLAATVHAVRHRTKYVKHHLQLLENKYNDVTSLKEDTILSYFSTHLPDDVVNDIVAKSKQHDTQLAALIENFVVAVIMDTAKLGSESSELQVVFLAGVLTRCIHQYFQTQTAHKKDNKVVPAVGTIEHDDLCIMWVNFSDEQNGRLNHIVPLLKKNQS